MRSCSALRSCFERAALPIPEKPSAAATANVINVVFIWNLQSVCGGGNSRFPARRDLVLEQALVVFFPFAHFTLSLVAGDPVRFLELAHQLVALAGDDIEIVIGQLAPLLLELALHLLPVAFHTVPIHKNSFGYFWMIW